MVRVFDVSDRVWRVPYLPGRDFLKYDQEFRVYKKVTPPSRSG